MAQRHIPGLTVAVVQDGKVVKSQGYGQASVELSAPATAATVYQLGSLTKQFTATAILRLVQDGKLGVDDKIAQVSERPAPCVERNHGPAAPQPDVRHPQLPRTDWTWGRCLKDYTGRRDHQAGVGQAAAVSRRARSIDYSNTNYHLLGMIVEKVSGKPYGDFLQERIFSARSA